MSKTPITFGTIIVDKLHMFFGVSDPSGFVVADMWANEDDGDEDVWVDHYRGHQKVLFSELRDESKYAVIGQADLNSDLSVSDQCKLAGKKWATENAEWVEARTADNKKRLEEPTHE